MRHEIFDLLLLVSCTFALWKGGAPERLAAISLVAGDLLSLATLLFRTGQFGHEEYGLFAVDALLLLALGAIAFRSTRWWPLFLTGLQLDGVLVHLIHIIDPRVVPIAYLNATALWSYPMVIILFIGTWRHRRRLRQHGSDPAWRRRVRPERAVAG